MRNKTIKILAAVVSAALLFGGLFLLFHDDIQVKIQEEKIRPFVPDFTLLELPEQDNFNQNNSTDIAEKTEENLTKQVQNLCDNFDNSVGWICIPETKINYPVMYSGDK